MVVYGIWNVYIKMLNTRHVCVERLQQKINSNFSLSLFFFSSLLRTPFFFLISLIPYNFSQSQHGITVIILAHELIQESSIWSFNGSFKKQKLQMKKHIVQYKFDVFFKAQSPHWPACVLELENLCLCYFHSFPPN